MRKQFLISFFLIVFSSILLAQDNGDNGLVKNNREKKLAQDNGEKKDGFHYSLFTFSYDVLTDQYSFDKVGKLRSSTAYNNIRYYQVKESGMMQFGTSYLIRALSNNRDFKTTSADTLYANEMQILHTSFSSFPWKFPKGGVGLNFEFDLGGRIVSYIEDPTAWWGFQSNQLAASPSGWGIGFGPSAYFRPLKIITMQSTLGYKWLFDARNAPKQTVSSGIYLDLNLLIQPCKKDVFIFHLYYGNELLKFIDQGRLSHDYAGKLSASTLRLGLGINFYNVFQLFDD